MQRLFRKPITLIFVLCMISVCISVIGAVACHNSGDKCAEKFDLPLYALSCVGCMVASFALFYVEMHGHNTGTGM